MSFASGQLADEGWEANLDRQPELAIHAWRALRHLQQSEDDHLISTLNQRRGGSTMADAVAFLELNEFIKRAELFWATVPVSSWARPNRDLAGNAQILGAVPDIRVRLDNGNQGYDGSIAPHAPGMPLRQVYMTDEETPKNLAIALTRAEPFPLEVGACSLSKCVAILRWNGALARLPFDPRISQLAPRLHFFAIAPERWKALVEDRTRAFTRLLFGEGGEESFESSRPERPTRGVSALDQHGEISVHLSYISDFQGID